MSIFDKWNDNVNDDEIKAKEEAIAKNSRPMYKELGSGEYVVKVEKMEVKKNNWGSEQISIDFKIVDGESKGQHIFYNGSFDNHFAHGFERTAKLIEDITDGELEQTATWIALEKGSSVANDLLLDVMEEIDGKFEYLLDYEVTESKKLNPNTGNPYKNKWYRIIEVYDA